MANTLLEMKSCLHGKYTASNEVTFASNTHLETKSHQVKWQSHTSYGRSKSCDNYTGKNSHAIPSLPVTPATAEARNVTTTQVKTVTPSHMYLSHQLWQKQKQSGHLTFTVKALVTPVAAEDKVTPLSMSHDVHTAWFSVGCHGGCFLALLLFHHLSETKVIS